MLIRRELYIVRTYVVAIMITAFLTFLGGPLSAASYDSETISMYTMNSASALKRINSGSFSVIYRGFGSRKPGEIERDELLGFRFMLDITHQSRGLRNLVATNEKTGLSPAEALKTAKKQQTVLLQKIFTTFAANKDLYENRPGKFEASKTGAPDPETHFIFASPRIGVARMYGPIVMVIEETRPRGMDLNTIARDARYYSLSRFLKNVGDRDFRLILADYVADRDEYVIPSYIEPIDVSGMIVYGTSPIVIGGRLAVPPPPIQRVYRKYYRKGALTIDVFDGRDKLITRLCGAPSAAEIGAKEVRSPAKLPTFIDKAWNDYLKTIRSKYLK